MQIIFTNLVKGDVKMDTIALIIAIIGALNWGSIGLFNLDLVATLFGGPLSIMSRIIYIAVGLSGIWCISLLFRRFSEKSHIE